MVGLWSIHGRKKLSGLLLLLIVASVQLIYKIDGSMVYSQNNDGLFPNAFTESSKVYPNPNSTE